MRRAILTSLGAVLLVGATGAFAEPPTAPASVPAMASTPVPNAYESLSPGNKRIAVALFEAQKSSTTADATPLTLDQIAQERRNGKSWGDVFQAMKSQGLIQAESLAQVLGRYNRARHSHR
jgi:hypothetical protein